MTICTQSGNILNRTANFGRLSTQETAMNRIVTLTISLLVAIFVSVPAYAQLRLLDVVIDPTAAPVVAGPRTFTLDDYFTGLHAVKRGGEIKVVHIDDRRVQNLIVEVSPGAIKVASSKVTVATKDTSLIYITTDFEKTITVVDTDKSVVQKKARIHVSQLCPSNDEASCRAMADEFFAKGGRLTAVGVVGLIKMSKLPQGELVFSMGF